MTFAERLKTLRKKYNYTQSELADIIGINRATVAGYETGRKQPNFETLIKIADAFNVSTDFLLCRKAVQNNDK